MKLSHVSISLLPARLVTTLVTASFLGALFLVAPLAFSQDDLDDDGEGLQGLVEEVGKEYAKAYLGPLAHTLGANQNSALYSTAAIPGTRVTVTFGLKVMNSRIAPEDQTFRRVLRVRLEDYGFDPDPDIEGEEGLLEIAGPTVFGAEEIEGSYIRAYYNGVPVGEREGIEGAIETRNVPLFMPELSVGGVAGFRATLRWLPTIEPDEEIGEIKLFGYGLQYSINQLFPLFPLDVMIGFAKQSLDVGDIIDTDATSFFLAASKTKGIATVYGGVAKESSSMKVKYTYLREDASNPDIVDEIPISFEIDGVQESRLTLGLLLKIGAQLNADVSFGDELTTFSGGLMFGF